MPSPAPLPTISARTTDCNIEFTFDGVLARLDSLPSPTLSFPCWIVGEGRRDPRLPNYIDIRAKISAAK